MLPNKINVMLHYSINIINTLKGRNDFNFLSALWEPTGKLLYESSNGIVVTRVLLHFDSNFDSFEQLKTH